MFAVYLTFQLKVFDFDLIALNFTPVTKQSIKLKRGGGGHTYTYNFI